MAAEMKGKIVFIDGRCEGRENGGMGKVIDKVTKAMSDPEVSGIVAAVKCCAVGDKAGCLGAKGQSDAKSESGRQGAAGESGAKSGPSVVNSNEYRESWERIFGGRKGAKEDLN